VGGEGCIKLVEQGVFTHGQLHVGKAAGPCADRDQAGHPLGALDGEVDRDRAAARASHEGCARDAEMIEQGERIRSVGEFNILGCRLAATAGVEANDIVARGEGGDLRIPHAQGRDARVEQEQCRRIGVPQSLVVEGSTRNVESGHA
jgi:hypothetical protein